MHHLQDFEEISAENRAFSSEFAKDVFLGLSHSPKWLSSKYFYDKKGDEIFQQIMNMPSYYLTNAEYEIFETHRQRILEAFSADGKPFRLVELGAGDGYKTKVLLKHFLYKDADFHYCPIDISGNVLEVLEKDMQSEVPGLSIECMVGDYFHMLADIATHNGHRNIVMFLGSNIGNFSENAATEFVRNIRKNIRKDDLLLLGYDLKKEPKVILDAYNDQEGITASFNYNLLERINRELGGDFDIDHFQHYASYNPVNGECRSYLLSRKEQSVTIGDLDETFYFSPWEPIFMEVSNKYAPEEMSAIMSDAGFEWVESFTDSNSYYIDGLWRAI
jgi:dimethylhistidine N-methyltransferase